MKGTLKKKQQGWVVEYDADERTVIGNAFHREAITLHPDSESLYMFAELREGWENDLEGREVEFEVRVYPSNARYAKIIYKEDVGHCAELDDGGCGLGCSYPECICQGNEIADCRNRTPEQVVLGYKTALVEDVFHQGTVKGTPEKSISKVYVRWNPLHEKVVCVHSSEESECIHCVEEREKVKGTAYSLEGNWFEVDSDVKLCYCGNPVDGSDPDCVTYGLCREHSVDA